MGQKSENLEKLEKISRKIAFFHGVCSDFRPQTLTQCLGTKLFPYEFIFHEYIQENRIETFCFIEKLFIPEKIEEK